MEQQVCIINHVPLFYRDIAVIHDRHIYLCERSHIAVNHWKDIQQFLEMIKFRLDMKKILDEDLL